MTTCAQPPLGIALRLEPALISSSPQYSSREGPPWLETFLSCTYFDPCLRHQFNKNEKNHFCIDCADGPLCSRGLLASHAKHRTLQVRKASHADGVRVENVCKLLDISSIQTYIINNHKIVFLLRQAKGKLTVKPGDAGAGATRHCQSCGRLLSDLVKFCSIKCKLLGVRRQQEIGANTLLSLSPEVRPLPPKGFHFHYDNVRNGSQHHISGFDLAAANKAFEEYRRKREVEVAPLSTNMDHDTARVGSILSPVSVLHALKPYGLEHATKLGGAPSESRICSRMANGTRKFEDVYGMMGLEDGNETKMRIEVALIHKLLLSNRRKRRKGLPQRAPLY